MNYEYGEVARFATQLLLAKGTGSYVVLMRVQFPGLSDYMLRKSYRDAKILVALRQVLKREKAE
jgi:hypothetical protein